MAIRPLAVLALTLCLGLGIGPASAAHTVSDDSGRQVTVRAPPLRIVSLTPGATEMLFAAGAGGELIATVEYSDEPPAARRVLRIGDVAAVDMERLVALRPDVVVAWPAGGNPAQREKIARLHIPVYEQQVVRLVDLPVSVRRLGALAGTAAAAERAAHDIEARLAALKRTYGTGGAGRAPAVLLQVWNRPIYTVGGRHLMSDALEICGARNVFADLPEAGPLVDTEAVIARDPDMIIAAAPPGEGAARAKRCAAPSRGCVMAACAVATSKRQVRTIALLLPLSSSIGPCKLAAEVHRGYAGWPCKPHRSKSWRRPPSRPRRRAPSCRRSRSRSRGRRTPLPPSRTS
ncbi:MAG: cobalamin-binding protein [Gammaproteobacteria bacterium]|nr:MAG: cobalamin-binding protein [Gammaproteobacteria bacterium]